MEKNHLYTLDDTESLALISKALSSEVRIRILKLLCSYKLNVNEIADKLDIPASSAAMNIKVLEECGLIGTEVQTGVRGAAKLCYKKAMNININLTTDEVSEKYETISMPIGNYVDYKVEPTCGIVSEKGRIDEEDEPRCFYNPERTTAKLLWLGKGYVEYRFPNHVISEKKVNRVEISAEICSEDHEYNMDWKSDITLWVNGKEAGTWCCPSDFGGRRGKLNPSWWPDKNTQYGKLMTWKLTEDGTYLGDEKVSDNKLSDYKLPEGGFISVKLGNADECEHAGGMNLFGSSFGDYPQDILMKIIYK